MPDTAVAADSHELYVWNAAELLEAVKHLGEGVRKGLEANETLKRTLDADVVALTQLIQAGAKTAKQIRLLGVLGRAYIKQVGAKKYIIFKGSTKLRPNLQGTRYLAENPKVRCFVVGSKDILEDAAKGTKVAIIAFVAIDIAAEVTSDHPSLASLGVRIASDVLQAAVAAFAGAAAGVLITTAFAGAPVVITFVVVIAVGFTVGVILTEIDRRYRLTERARARMMGYEETLKKDLAIGEQRVVAAGQRTLQYGRQVGREVKAGAYRAGQEIKVEAYRVDRYFSSLAAMMAADTQSYFGP